MNGGAGHHKHIQGINLHAVLRGEGISEPAVGSKTGLFNQAYKVLSHVEGPADESLYGYYVPGRIEVLGKHTDYAGGHSLVAAAERGFCLLARPRSDRIVRITDVGFSETIEFELGPDLEPEIGSWSNYPMTVARRVARNFAEPLRGGEVAFGSDLPVAAGMSSSSALMVGIFLILCRINQLEERAVYRDVIQGPEALAEYLGTVENGQSYGPLAGDKGVGTFGGSEDHMAMLCSEAGRMKLYGYGPVGFKRSVKMPAGYAFAIAGSGVAAEKTGGAREKYNRASRLAGRAVDVWRKKRGGRESHLGAIAREASNVEPLRRMLRNHRGDEFKGEELLERFEHFYAENEEIIPKAVAALEEDELSEFGRQVDRSQELAETLLKNQVAETVFLARRARELGAAAASAFGAGFGGSVWALVREEKVEAFIRGWAESYRKAYSEVSQHAQFFASGAGPAAWAVF